MHGGGGTPCTLQIYPVPAFIGKKTPVPREESENTCPLIKFLTVNYKIGFYLECFEYLRGTNCRKKG